ncbi:MAG: ATP-NAD kinase family protein [archaeon]|nr:ATP-NAD kinase family protein [archaeon]MDA1168073.1 ATP-NAD kinase family protein [archaeon]
MRIGLVVNPDAGLGGRLGFKGSDGRAREARDAGANDRSGPRMQECLAHLFHILNSGFNRSNISVSYVGWTGRMGHEWMPEPSMVEAFEAIGATPETTSAEDTSLLVEQLIDANVDVILYAGGDGTTRDIVLALEQAQSDDEQTPLVGVPGGVKMHSGCFATTPKAAAEVVLAFGLGDLQCAITEVMDLDEEVYQQGEWRVRMYGEAWTPSSPRYMQGAKEQVERESEEETLQGLAKHVESLIEEDDDLMVIWGSGGTLQRMGKFVGKDLTLLGIDISHQTTLHNDLNEQGLIDIISGHVDEHGEQRSILLLLSPMGGQGFLIGRGNLQLSPAVLRLVGMNNILGVATPAKLLGLESLRIDTGDGDLDEEFKQKRYIKVLQGFRTTRLLRIAQ